LLILNNHFVILLTQESSSI